MIISFGILLFKSFLLLTSTPLISLDINSSSLSFKSILMIYPTSNKSRSSNQIIKTLALCSFNLLKWIVHVSLLKLPISILTLKKDFFLYLVSKKKNQKMMIIINQKILWMILLEIMMIIIKITIRKLNKLKKIMNSNKIILKFKTKVMKL